MRGTSRRGATPANVPPVNPFAKMGLQSSDRETPTATFAELQAFRAKASELGFPSLATAALLAWEWLQREEDIFGTFDVTHYRPKERPHTVRVLHEKTQRGELGAAIRRGRRAALSRIDGRA